MHQSILITLLDLLCHLIRTVMLRKLFPWKATWKRVEVTAQKITLYSGRRRPLQIKVIPHRLPIESVWKNWECEEKLLERKRKLKYIGTIHNPAYTVLKSDNTSFSTTHIGAKLAKPSFLGPKILDIGMSTLLSILLCLFFVCAIEKQVKSIQFSCGSVCIKVVAYFCLVSNLILYHSEYYIFFTQFLIRNGGKKQSMSGCCLPFKLVGCFSSNTCSRLQSGCGARVLMISWSRASSESNASVENTRFCPSFTSGSTISWTLLLLPCHFLLLLTLLLELLLILTLLLLWCLAPRWRLLLLLIT